LKTGITTDKTGASIAVLAPCLRRGAAATSLFTLLGSLCSVRVQVPFTVPALACSRFEPEHEQSSENHDA
jgi:hypothetical protein